MALPANFTRQLLIVVILSIVLLGAMAAFGNVEEVLASIRLLGWSVWGIIRWRSLSN